MHADCSLVPPIRSTYSAAYPARYGRLADVRTRTTEQVPLHRRLQLVSFVPVAMRRRLNHASYPGWAALSLAASGRGLSPDERYPILNLDPAGQDEMLVSEGLMDQEFLVINDAANNQCSARRHRACQI